MRGVRLTCDRISYNSFQLYICQKSHVERGAYMQVSSFRPVITKQSEQHTCLVFGANAAAVPTMPFYVHSTSMCMSSHFLKRFVTLRAILKLQKLL
jgi:hypothetical protein